jgi:radical SAM superfamily enzyme YgiQ (UPF0313 family)
MKVLLVFPEIRHGSSTYSDPGAWKLVFGYPIITLPHLAAITPDKHDVKIVNENYDTLDYDEDVDLVGITTYTMTAPRAYKIADEFRRRGKTVVMGGYHVTALPEEALEHADCVVQGLAELTWPRVLEDFEKGKLKRLYERDHDFDISKVPPLRRDLITHNPFLGAIQTTKGCPHTCEFCAISSFCGRMVKQRPIKDVVEEIKSMPNKIFVIHDPHLTLNKKYAKELFKEMIRQNVHKQWVANGTTDVLATVDKDFLDLARKAGCVEWFVGFESVNQEALNETHKTHNKVENFSKLINRLHDYNMAVQGGIIFGFDHDTPDVFDTTLETINQWNMDVLEINILTPYPGTKLYEKLDNAGRIFTKDWTKYNQVEVVFDPKNMTPEELMHGAQKVAKEFYSIPRIIKRGTKTITTVKGIGRFKPALSNFAFRKYYKRDFNF